MNDYRRNPNNALPTYDDVTKGYYAPPKDDLECPNDERVFRSGGMLEAPRFCLMGIEKFRREQEQDYSPQEVKAARLQAVCEHQGILTLSQMKGMMNVVERDIEKLEATRKAIYSPASADLQTRYNQIRNELSASGRSQQISAIEAAIHEANEDLLRAVVSLPHTELLCPKASYERAKNALERIVMGAERGVLNDLNEIKSRLAFAIHHFENDIKALTKAPTDESTNSFDAAMSAEFFKNRGAE